MDSEASKPTRNPPISRKSAAAILLLSGLSAISILRPELLPNLLPQGTPALQRLSLPLAFLAILAALNALRRREAWPSIRQLWQPVVTGLGLFAAYPFMLSTGFATDGYTRTILFASVPICCLIIEAAMAEASTGSALQNRLALPAGLAGIFGALCVFPLEFPASFASAAGFGATVLTAACIAAALCLAVRTAPTSAPGAFAAVSAGTAALALTATSLYTSQSLWAWRPTLPELLWTVALELPQLMLLLWLVRRPCSANLATRIATRYLFSPLLAILAGAALLQQSLTLRTSLGLLLMAAGGAWLLFHPHPGEDDNSSALSLR